MSLEQALVMDGVLRALGVEAVFYEGDKNADDGFIFTGNPQRRVSMKTNAASVPQASVAGHELFHHVEAGAAGHIVDKVYNTVIGNIGQDGVVQFIKRTSYTEDLVKSEASADVSGGMFAPTFATIPFWRQVTHGVAAQVGTAKAKKAFKQFNRAVGKRIAAVKNVLNNNKTNQTGYSTSRMLTDAGIVAAQKAIIEATRDFYGRGVAGDMAE